ncbi:MAG: rRNA pseudouridine synthase [Clostridiales bacterium]|nr:rRNA pseudouridine synthase [Clostridiales bacterium]
MRINKYLSSCGIDSRRKCEQLVIDGRVKINGKKITDLATDVNDYDIVEVDGHYVTLKDKKTYIMLNKPKGCVTTVSDDKGRKTVLDFVKVKTRVYPVGRLDYDTEGLLLLTDDGDLANIIMHPRNAVRKTYSVRVEGELTDPELKKIRNGVEFEGVKYSPAEVKVVGVEKGETKLTVTVAEGKNHEIKKILEAVGKTVSFLKRVSIGDLKVGGLKRGEWRYLKPEEIAYLKSL